jgi:hypothetical protein
MITNKIMFSTIRVKWSFYFFFLLFALSLLFSGCQKESEEIEPPPIDKIIAPNSAVDKLIRSIALHDGSFDNIIDFSSCTSVVLPVTVLANGHEIRIGSKDEFKLVERILDEFSNDDDKVAIVFPINVITANHETLKVNNGEELKNIIKACKEGGSDDDIECIDFKYPLIFLVYNSANQVASAVTIDDDRQLLIFLNGLDTHDLVGFKFPVILVTRDGQEVIVTNNKQMEDSIENASKNCDEDDDNDFDDDDVDDTALITVLTTGTWKIAYFFDKIDETPSFKNLIFTFNLDGTAVVTTPTSTGSGIWKSYSDSGLLEIEFDFGQEPPFDAIRNDWELVTFSNTEIRLKNSSGGSGSNSILVFEKE